jgi:hypothetical protein
MVSFPTPGNPLRRSIQDRDRTRFCSEAWRNSLEDILSLRYGWCIDSCSNFPTYLSNEYFTAAFVKSNLFCVVRCMPWCWREFCSENEIKTGF